MPCHACARCRRVLQFLTAPDGAREATCCQLRYVRDRDLPDVCYVALWQHDAPGPDQLGVLDLRTPSYSRDRESILHEAGPITGKPRKLL